MELMKLFFSFSNVFLIPHQTKDRETFGFFLHFFNYLCNFCSHLLQQEANSKLNSLQGQHQMLKVGWFVISIKFTKSQHKRPFSVFSSDTLANCPVIPHPSCSSPMKWRCVFQTHDENNLFCQNQHEELKRQYYELHEQHQQQGEDHSRLLDEHKERFDKLQKAKEVEVSQLKGARALLCPRTS